MSRGDSQPDAPGIDGSGSRLLDNLSTAVVLLDGQLCVRYANPATEQLLATSASLAYFDAYRPARLPANLTQAQRDYFGAHTYRRIDKEGSFHTEWESK